MGYPFSASSAARVEACPSSVLLQQVYRVTEDGARGTSIHLYAKRVVHGMPRAEALAMVPKEYRATCDGFDVESALADLHGMRAEVSYAVSLASDEARELGVDIDRRYVVSDSEVPGSSDVEGYSFTGRPVVIDWKTGNEVAPCESNLQMGTYALARSRIDGSDEVVARIAYVGATGRVRFDSHVYTRIDLDGVSDRLISTDRAVSKARERQALGEPMQFAPGDHCKWCPALTGCPAQTSLARSMADDVATIEGSLQAMTPAQRGAAWIKLDAIGVVYDRIKDALKMMAAQEPIPVRDGYEARAVSFEKASVPVASALALARTKGATDADIEAITKRKTETQIRVVRSR